MRSVFLIVLATLVLSGACTFPLRAQNATGAIEGAVLDPSQAGIQRADATITNQTTGWAVTVTTNELGLYSVRNLAPGLYSARIAARGFAAATIGITVETGAIANGTVTLQLSTRNESIQVASTAVSVDPVRHTVDTIIDENEIRDLPISSRNALDLAQVAPGVVVSSAVNLDPTKAQGYRAIGISGRFGAGTRVEVDGIEINDYAVGSTTLNLPPDGVHEFQVTRSSQDVSAPMTSSGVVSINMKSGTNSLHGRAFADYSNQDFNARSGYLATVSPYRQARGGVSAGGPFIANKLFWFGGWDKTDLQNTWRNTDPLFPQINRTQNVPTSVRYLYGHADWNLAHGVHAFYGILSESNLTTGGVLTQPYTNANWAAGHTAGIDITTGSWSHGLRLGFVNYNNRIAQTEFSIPAPRTPQGQPYLLRVGSYQVGPNPAAPQSTGESTLQSGYDGSWSRARHVLRFGARLNLVTTAGFIGETQMQIFGTYNNAIAGQIQSRGADPADPLESLLSG